MKNTKIRYRFILILLIVTPFTHAQKKYLAEIGCLGGGTFYLGDANAVPFKKMGATYGGFIKYKLDKRYSFGVQSTGGFCNIPAFEHYKAEKSSFWDIEATAEFNFFDFGYDRLKSTTQRASPYIFTGLGCSVYNSRAAFMIPFGIGGKFKLGERFNMGITWSMYKLFKDDFDKIDNPKNLKKSMFINKDWYSKITIYISLDFWESCRNCYSGLSKKR